MSTIPTLAGIPNAVAQDPGLLANVSAEDLAGGVAAAELMNGVIAEAMETGARTR